MNKTYFEYLTFLFLIFLGHNLTAQVQKFGKITKDELAMKSYEKDTSAHAVVLFDVGRTYFSYNTSEGGFQMIFERHRRVKIFDKEGYDLANERVSLYSSGTSDENISGLKGFTFQNQNGKIVKHKLEKDGVFEEETSKNWRAVNFTMPNISEGCVIEYTYKVTSDFNTFLEDWYFQEEIPVIYSEYKVEIPEYLKYQKVTQGYHTLTLKDRSNKSGSVTFMSTERSGWTNVKQNISNQTVNYNIETETWVLEHVPAIKRENFMTTVDDYVSKISYQLAATDYPSSGYRNVLGSWEKISETLLNHEKFGLRLGKGAFLNEAVATIQAKSEKHIDQVVLAYEFIRNEIEWDKKRGLFTNNTLKKVFDNKKGNAAEINLLLTSLIQELGYVAHPVALSTRDNGKINISMPMLQRFNYVVCAANIGGKYILLDATSRYTKPGMLPSRCLNWQGRIISETNSDWINLNPTNADEMILSSFLTINEEGYLNGGMIFSNKGYRAAYEKVAIDNDGMEEYIEDMKEDFEESFIINDYELKDTKGKFKVDVKIDVESTEGGMGNLIYVNPLPTKIFDENPFKQETRSYPVDFAVPIKRTIRSNIQLPVGVEVDEMPEPSVVSLPNKAGLFSFKIVNQNNMLQVVCNFSLDKTIFLPDEYPLLKQFFDIVIAKQEEKIVLKRKS